MMLRGAASGLNHVSYLRDGGIVCNGIASGSHSLNLRVKSLSPSLRTTIVSLGGRRHHRRRDGSSVAPAKKYRSGDDTVEITLDFDELKRRAGEAAASTKKSLVSSVGDVREVSTLRFLLLIELIMNLFRIELV